MSTTSVFSRHAVYPGISFNNNVSKFVWLFGELFYFMQRFKQASTDYFRFRLSVVCCWIIIVVIWIWLIGLRRKGLMVMALASKERKLKSRLIPTSVAVHVLIS